MIGGLLISIILSYCLWKTFVYWWSNRNFYELASKIPATSGNLPLIGQAHKLIGIDSKGANFETSFKRPLSENQKTFFSPLQISFSYNIKWRAIAKDFLDRTDSDGCCRSSRSSSASAFFERLHRQTEFIQWTLQ